ncbi:MAG: A/G-specific adenine glycosylase [Gammaproteobacteria bacterium]|nr:A/G-specific adenine glycosylase [Gammaproteobacteria bacterium]MBU1481426.1 A/G-specific adenine glycosylase [Gammaproteobacteria bacterium]
MPSFASRLIEWQCTHGRHDLPWQGGDAYRVWLSEIMLQQTQVATVIPYYQRFVTAFPNIAALAAATEERVLVNWSGLGYYARARNLHKAAQIIMEKHRGEFPRKFEDIVELPGIGRSTAAAVCALAFHEHRAILDGNVKRVLARYCGIAGWAGEKKVEEVLWQQAEVLLPASPLPAGERVRERGGVYSSIATYTQALMDMGATVCTRSKPKCVLCPVQADCVALQTERVAELPTPRPRKTVPERNAVFLLLMHGNDILLEKRPGSGIWGGLWCPPQFDDEDAARDWFLRSGLEARGGERLATFTHTFTHFKLHITPLRVELARKPVRAAQPGSVWLEVGEALGAAIPTPVRALLKQLQAVSKHERVQRASLALSPTPSDYPRRCWF